MDRMTRTLRTYAFDADKYMKDEVLEAQYVVFTEIVDEDGFVWHPTLRKGATEKDIIGMFAAIESLKNQAKLGGYKPYIRQSGFPKKEVKIIEGRTCPVCQGKIVEGSGRQKERCENYKWSMTEKKNIGTCSYLVWNPST